MRSTRTMRRSRPGWDSWPQGEPMSDEAAAFMYMQLGLTELELFREE